MEKMSREEECKFLENIAKEKGLTDEQLKEVAGGSCSMFFCCDWFEGDCASYFRMNG